jgi:hypothetical protein
MKIRAGYQLSYDCPQPTPMILTLSVYPHLPIVVVSGSVSVLPFLLTVMLCSFVVADGTSDHRTNDAVMTSVMACDAADDGCLYAASGISGAC